MSGGGPRAALHAQGAGANGGASHLLVVAGAGGEPRYTEAFGRDASALADAAARRFGLPAENIACLVEDPSSAGPRCATRSTRAAVESATTRIAARARPGDRVFVVLIGHGSGERAASRFNLPGPDLDAAGWARLLDRLPRQKVAFVNAASASGDFVPVLAAPGRAVVTATKSAMERNETIFGRHFVAAFTGDGADADKDGRLSLLEAFDYARREVARAYEQGNRLLTEHALLDDDGDGKGTAAPDARSSDGALARTLWLGGGGAVASRGASDPRVAALEARRDSLDARLDALRRRRESMDSTAYARELERLLLDIATTGRELRAAGGRP